MNIVFILGETINDENPTNSSEIESTPKVEPKTVRWSPDNSNLFLSSPSVFSFLNYALHLSVYEMCDKYRGQLLFILIPDLTKPY